MTLTNSPQSLKTLIIKKNFKMPKDGKKKTTTKISNKIIF